MVTRKLKACTILIHKKGDSDTPENFRPITLEPVTLKIFTSLLRNRMYEFLLKNSYVESHYQKGFTPGLSGTFEHITEMSDLINHARNKQRSLTVTLIDLRNAFGEVNHALIDTALQYHHVPEKICELVQNLYTDFKISVITKDYQTSFISVKRGVLQGDSFSPLLFNMIINTFIQSIKSNDYTTFGYLRFKGFLPRNWFQFADNAAAVTALESENQILLNLFSRWCQWCDMSIRLDKCYSFGITKRGSKAMQYYPKLYIYNQEVKAIKNDEHFTYLGRHFDFKMTDNQHKENLEKRFKDLISITDNLQLQPKNKIALYHRYILSKVSGDMTVSNLSITWVKENLDNVLCKYIRSWLEIPISGTLETLKLLKNRSGIALILPITGFILCKTTFRNTLRNSKNINIRETFNATSQGKNIQYDQYLTTKEALNKLREMTEDRIKNELTTQSLIIKSIWNYGDSKSINQWSSVLQGLPKNIYSFVLRYLNNSLANATNQLKWGVSNNAVCLFCHENQTLGHVIGGCKVALHEKRYNWRHDSILLNIAKVLSPLPNTSVYCDINDEYQNPSVISGENYRPDIIVKQSNSITIIELTVGFETNIEKNLQRKMQKYQTLIKNLSANYQVTFVNLSMGSIGVIGNGSNFRKAMKNLHIDNNLINFLIKRIINISIRSTYFVFCKRNSEWDNPELLYW